MGTLYTFYSYKGGVGRSMALANVAALLANWGHSVLAIDWDLEAPGLEKYFMKSPSRLDGSRSEKQGVVDLVTAFTAGAPLDWEAGLLKAYPFGTDAHVDILSAGRDTPEYVPRLQSIDWRRLFNEHRFGAYLEEMRDEWLNKYDFVLVDSRTGITDIGGVCTIHLPDFLVLLFTANEQSLNGVINVIQRAREKYDKLPEEYERPKRLVSPEGPLVRKLLGVPVPSRFEYATEYEKGREWLGTFARKLADIYADWLPRGTTPEAVLEKLFIPNIPFWSFGEELPVVQEGTSNPKSIGFSYELLARLLKNKLQWQEALRGGAAGAGERAPELVNREADRIYAGLIAADQEVARQVFPNLVLVAPAGESENTRRRVSLSEFDEPSRRVIMKLTEARLLAPARDEATGEETVEIAQDSTLRHWEQLRKWLEEDHDFLLWRQQLRASVPAWVKGGRSPGDLLRGSKLETAKQFMETHGDVLTPAEREYVTASKLERERAARVRLYQRIGSVVLFLIFMAFVFYQYRANRQEEERKQREIAYNRAVAATAQGIDRADAKDFGAAMERYDEAISLASDYDAAYYNRGIARANLGQSQLAIADFQKVLQISSDEQTRRAAEDYLQQLQNPETNPTPVVELTPTPQATPTPRVRPSPGPSPTPAPTLVAISVQPRVYIQIQDAADMPKAKQIAATLERQGFLVSSTQVRGGPPATQVRFYRKDETKEAALIVDALKRLGVTDAETRYLIGYENSTNVRPKHYELWFGPRSLENVRPSSYAAPK